MALPLLTLVALLPLELFLAEPKLKVLWLGVAVALLAGLGVAGISFEAPEALLTGLGEGDARRAATGDLGMPLAWPWSLLLLLWPCCWD